VGRRGELGCRLGGGWGGRGRNVEVRLRGFRGSGVGGGRRGGRLGGGVGDGVGGKSTKGGGRGEGFGDRGVSEMVPQPWKDHSL